MWTGTEFGGPDLATGTDWNDVVYQTGYTQNYNINLTQGSEKGGVNLSLNFHDQEGVVIETGYQRVGLRLNSHYNFANDAITIGQNLGVTREERIWADDGFGGTHERGMLIMKPVLPVRTEDGRITGPPGQGFSDRDNPVGVATDNKDDRINTLKVVGNVYLDWRLPINGLSFRTNFGIDYDNHFIRDIRRTYQRGFLSQTVAELVHGTLIQTNWVWNNTLTYTRDIGQHSFSVLAGTEAIKNSLTVFNAQSQEFALETADYFQISAGSGAKTATGATTGFSLLSYFGKARYSFDNRYLASFTVRRDGSSRFGTNNLYGIFPAASVGWRLSEEAFFQDVSWLSNLKIRAAWGRTGNQDILNDARFGLYEAIYAPLSVILPWGDGGLTRGLLGTGATSYDISNNGSGLLPSGFSAQQTENQDLKWETQTEINIGLDIGLIDDRITGSFEYFQKKTKDILIRPTPVRFYGDGFSRWANGADMETTGFEFTLGYFSQLGRDWSYSVSINGAHYADKITALPEDLWASYPGNSEQNIIGHSPFSIFGYISDGIIQSQAELEAAPQYPGIRVGQLRYVDMNGDGVVNALDQEYYGVNGRPDLEYGINGQIGWKDFDLSLQFVGMAGRQVSNGFAGFDELGAGGTQHGGTSNLNAWTFVNTDTHIPALTSFSSRLEPNTWSTRDGGFLNLRQVTLGYTMPSSVIGNAGWLSNLRVYVSMENIKYWYNNSGPNSYRGPAWLIDQQRSTPNLTGSRDDTFNEFFPKPLRATLGVNIGF